MTEHDPSTPTLGELEALISAAHAETVAAREAMNAAAHRLRIGQDNLARLVAEYDALAKSPLS